MLLSLFISRRSLARVIAALIITPINAITKITHIPFSECFSKPRKALVEKHIRNINSGADLVLTNFPDVAEELRRNNIAVYYAVPGKNNIIQEIRNAQNICLTNSCRFKYNSF